MGLVYASSPFVTTLREMLEMKYLWQRPVRLDNVKLVSFLGAEPHTPIGAAVRATSIGRGSLGATDDLTPRRQNIPIGKNYLSAHPERR